MPTNTRVVILGSCRVRDPLAACARNGQTQLAQGPVGHIHNPSEILQALETLDGARQLREELRDYLSFSARYRPDGSDQLAPLRREADVVVVEISSLRIVRFEGVHLQINRFREMAAKAGVPRELLSSMYTDPDAWRAAVAQVDVDSAEGNFRPVVGSEFWEMDGDEITNALTGIRALLPGPLLLVGIVVNNFQGKPVPQRAVLRNRLASFAATNDGVGFLDPTDAAEAFGYRAALKDLGHYTPEFEEPYSRVLLDAIERLV